MALTGADIAVGKSAGSRLYPAQASQAFCSSVGGRLVTDYDSVKLYYLLVSAGLTNQRIGLISKRLITSKWTGSPR